MENANEKTNKKQGGFFGWIERVGDKLPPPFIMFLWLVVIVLLLSLILGGIFKVSVVSPIDNKRIYVKNLLSGEGIDYMLENMVKNFTGFAPLGLVLTMLLGVGLAERVGLISAFMKKTILGASPIIVTFIIMLIGTCGNLASDAAIVIVPAISAAIFLSLGRNPIAGLAVGYAATTAGFSANLFIAGTDATLAGISTEAIHIVNKNMNVSPVCNWYFMIVSTFVLSAIGTFISEKIVEPGLGKYEGSKDISLEDQKITPNENKGLKAAGIATIIYVAVIVLATLPQNSFFRNPKTHGLINSPLLNSIIPILLLFFITVGITYGKVAGTIKESSDVPKYMTDSVKEMSSYIVLIFIISQFMVYFSWSKLGYVLAIGSAHLLKTAKFTGIPLFVIYILLCGFINIFIGSASAKWALLAPVFIPMFYMLGYKPELAQLLYRIGDSTTNIISPLFPYFPIILGLVQKYDKKAGMGSIISMMMPYTLIMLAGWIIMVIVWYLFKLPIGPGVGII